MSGLFIFKKEIQKICTPNIYIIIYLEKSNLKKGSKYLVWLAVKNAGT